MWTWLYNRNMTIPGIWTLPCGVVSPDSWVLAAVPDARDKGHSRGLQSPLCQRHVTDIKCLYMPLASRCQGFFSRYLRYRVAVLICITSLVSTPDSRQVINNRFLHNCVHFDHPKTSHTSFLPLGQDFGIQHT